MGKNPQPGTGTTFDPEAEKPQTKTSQTNDQAQALAQPGTPAPSQLITLTSEQFDQLINRLNAGNVQDRTPAPSMTPGVGLQVDPFGRAVGTIAKFNTDPAFYPDPVERLLEFCETDRRMRRHRVSENYFITWDITAKPYQTKDNLSIAEPTFHLTLYANEFDDQGDPTERAIVIQTLHMNEDEELANQFATEQGLDMTEETLRFLMDETRFERARRWLVDIFYPPRLFDLNVDDREEAIGGTVVKVVTKSNVKGFGNKAPKISDEELS